MNKCDYKIICMVEGKAEMAILEMLMEHNQAFFTIEDLIDERIYYRLGGQALTKRFFAAEI